MESKVKVKKYYENLCMGCLSVNHALQTITNKQMQQFYIDIIHEIDANPIDGDPKMCFHCIEGLQKSLAFKEQVTESYKALLMYPEKLHDSVETETDCLAIPGNGQADSHGRTDMDQVYIKMEDDVKHEFDDEIDTTMPVEGFSLDSTDSDMDKPIKKLQKNKKLKTKSRTKKSTTEKNKSKKTKKGNDKVITIELSVDEMNKERELDMNKDTYLKASYKCESCIIGFSHSQSYNSHMKARHDGSIGDYVCPVCKTVAASLESFTTHYKRHMKRYECRACGLRTSDAKAMRAHQTRAHGAAPPRYRCQRCGKVSHSVDAHRYHRDSHKARVPCDQCDKTFSHRAGLMNHRLAFHGDHNRFECPVCSRVFRWKASLKRHAASTHRPGGRYLSGASCASCDVSFASLASYQRHLRTSLKHVSQEDLRFICDDCGRRFSDKTKLRDHIEEKHLHKTFHCHICNKPSRNRVGLEQHVRNVHRGRPRDKMCHHCGKGFPTKMQLESHVRSHTGERPFICEHCPTTFSQQSSLYKHNRQVHLNIKSKRSTPKKKDEKIPDPPPLEVEMPPLNPPLSIIQVQFSSGFIM